MVFDTDAEQDSPEVTEAENAEELKGKMGSDPDDERLAHSILENDEQTIDDGKLLADSVDYALGTFTPDLFFEKLVKDYKSAQRLFGPTIIRELSGYDGGYIERNVKVTEFREEMRKNIQRNINRMQKEGLLDKEGAVTETGLQLAALVRYTEELDKLQPKGLGKREHHEKAHYGEKDQIVPFKNQRYKDLDMRGSIQRAVRRAHTKLLPDDLRAVTRKQHGKISIIYGLDASGSMRGRKMMMCKRAGIALAYKAIEEKNDVGLIIFTSKIEKSIPPTQDFRLLLEELTKVRAGHETDLGLIIDHAVQLFGNKKHTKHLILLSDALPTKGEDPGKIALDAAAHAREAGITISMIGIGLEEEGEKLAIQLVELGGGKLYRVTDLDQLGTIILEDYEQLKHQ